MAWGSGIWGTGVWGVDEALSDPGSVDVDVEGFDPYPITGLIDVEYKYNYLVTLSRNTGAPINLNRTDASLGQELEHESAANTTPLRARDFLESITLNEISQLDNNGNQINLEMPFGDNRHYTHFSVYRTTNILADDADFRTVENKFFYVDDVPLSKMGYAISFFQEPNGNTGLITFESETMSVDDVGTVIKSEDLLEEYTILEYIERSGINVVFRVTAESLPTNPTIDQWYIVGGQNYFQGYREVADNGDIMYVAEENTRDFNSSDVGLQLFWADGRISFITKVLETDRVVVFEPDGVPTDFNNSGAFSCSVDPSIRVFNDTIEDDMLKSYERRGDNFYFLQTRFFKPLPDGGFGAVKGGAYFVSAVRDSEYYYSQVRDFYRTGAYHPTKQKNTKPVGTITRLKEYPDVLCIFGKHFTFYLDTTVEINGGEPLLREFIVSYADPKLITNKVGCFGEGCTASIDNGGEIIYTNEPAVRLFDGSKYSDNIAVNAIQDSKIAELNVEAIMEWDIKRGLNMWSING
ncbi:MAG: hypothetical protein CMI54_07865 [Parcubacteria group bacterium]|jgi:hypothetical protein|nr:hypothetical protein [Parcubacteria group bacterium]|tara:strand:+ start:6083 stop:7651 length:1569 start_codon:yes stop_codon:yes gene_type:complete